MSYRTKKPNRNPSFGSKEPLPEAPLRFFQISAVANTADGRLSTA